MRETSCDILIIGASTGGVAAALACTSLGYRVILSEPCPWVGGQLTSQAVPPDENLRIESDGCTRRYAEFRRQVRQYYRDHYPLTQAARAQVHLNPGLGRVSPLCFEPRIGHHVLQTMLAWPVHRGLLQVWLGYQPTAAHTQGDRVNAVTLQSLHDASCCTITARYILDATELGDLLPLAGVEYVTGAESHQQTGEPQALTGAADPQCNQSITWCFPVAWDPTPGANHVADPPPNYAHWRQYIPDTDPVWPGPLLSWTIADHHTGEPRERSLFNVDGWHQGLWKYRRIVCKDHYPPKQAPHEVTLVNWPQNDYFVRPLLDVSAAEQALALREAKELSLSLFYWMQTQALRHDGGIGYPELYLRPDLVGTPDGLAQYPYIRESRRIRARFTILEQHVSQPIRGAQGATPFADSVGIGHYMIDLHHCTAKGRSVNTATHPFQIPLGALLPVRVTNLLPACKNLGTTHITNGCYRLHPVEWNIGESAGLLAAFCLSAQTSPHAVHESAHLLRAYQALLTQQGIPLAWSSYP